MRNKKIILIGGAAGTGKTTLAKKLSLEMGVPWISTDQIQAVVKSAMGETWIEFGEGLSAEEVFQKEIERCEIVWRGVLAFIKHLYPWDACVIEGMAILPHLVERDLVGDKNVRAVFLCYEDTGKITEVVSGRSTQVFIKTKTEEQQKFKVREISLFNDFIKSSAEKYGVEIFSSKKDHSSIF